MTSVQKLVVGMSPADDATSAIVGAYRRRTARSAEAFVEAQRHLAGGVVRQAGHWFPYPVTLERGDGARVWDIDGNAYLDLINNYASLVHGHGYPPIVAAVSDVLRKGTAWVGNCAAQSELARLLAERVPSVDQVRFTNSGAEAATLALLIARSATGRSKFLMARYGYHGSMTEHQAGSLDMPGPATYLARYNDLEAFEAVLAAHGDEIAAVFLEPVQTFGGVVEGSRDFLHGVCAAAHRAGALLVLDEVVTFRLGVGGVQRRLQLEPDLTMFGKLIGGGFPIGAVGGKRQYLSLLDSTTLRAVHSGTFNGNPVSTTAGVVSVRDLTSERIESIERQATSVRAGLTAAAEKVGLPIRINQAGSLLQIFFQRHLPENPLLREDRDAITRFHLAALNHGLLLAPRGLIALSTALTGQQVEEVIGHSAGAMRDLADEV